MKAAYIDQTGPPENIRFGELPTPTPRDSQVAIRVKAVAVNPIDTYVRSGTVQVELPTPFIVGVDLAGVVEATGAQASRFKPGDRVWGSNQGIAGRQGTFAEYAVVDEQWLYPLPDRIDDEDAAAVACVGMTAHLGLFGPGQLTDKDTVFVHGGTGGVGSCVVQMARAIGARVITTGGSGEKVRACEDLGADVAINYKNENIADRVRQVAGEGVTLWWETLREPDFDLTVDLLAPGGRMIVMAGREARPPFPVGPFYVKGCSLFGVSMLQFTARQQRCSAGQINQWLVDGKLKARIDRILPLSQTAAAHRLQEQNTIGKAGTLAGKIVLTPDP